jgi:hypothetical protein
MDIFFQQYDYVLLTKIRNSHTSIDTKISFDKTINMT